MALLKKPNANSSDAQNFKINNQKFIDDKNIELIKVFSTSTCYKRGIHFFYFLKKDLMLTQANGNQFTLTDEQIDAFLKCYYQFHTKIYNRSAAHCEASMYTHFIRFRADYFQEFMKVYNLPLRLYDLNNNAHDEPLNNIIFKLEKNAGKLNYEIDKLIEQYFSKFEIDDPVKLEQRMLAQFYLFQQSAKSLDPQATNHHQSDLDLGNTATQPSL